MSTVLKVWTTVRYLLNYCLMFTLIVTDTDVKY